MLVAYAGGRLPRLLLILLTTESAGSTLTCDSGYTVQAVVADESGLVLSLAPKILANIYSAWEGNSFYVSLCPYLGALVGIGLHSELRM